MAFLEEIIFDFLISALKRLCAVKHSYYMTNDDYWMIFNDLNT